MTALVSPLTRVSKAGVSGADFTTLESSVAANTAKPTATAVDSQIDTKNAAQNLQISLKVCLSTRAVTSLSMDSYSFWFRTLKAMRPVALTRQTVETSVSFCTPNRTEHP